MKREKELFLDWCYSERNLEEITLEAYGTDLDGFIEYLSEIGVDSIRTFNESHLEAWIVFCSKLLDNKQITDQTCTRRRVSVRRFLKFLFNEELCRIDPAMVMEAQSNTWKIPIVLSEKQIDMLLAQPNRNTILVPFYCYFQKQYFEK